MVSRFIINSLVLLPSLALYAYANLNIPNIGLMGSDFSLNQFRKITPYQTFKIFTVIFIVESLGQCLLF